MYANIQNNISVDIKAVQKECLKIMNEIHKICLTNDISYSLSGGSVIGAHLFNGFIPWDDDLDIVMTRYNYKRFLAIAPDQLPEQFTLENYKTSNHSHVLFSKIVNKNTTLLEEHYGNIFVGGAFVDIFVVDEMTNRFRFCITDLMMIWHNLIVSKKFGCDYKFKYEKILRCIFAGNFIVQNHKKIFSYIELFCEKNNKNKSLFVYETYAASRKFRKIRLEKKLFDDIKLISFETSEFYIFNNYQRYLYQKFGRKEFRKYLPLEQRDKQHSMFFSNSIAYEEFNLSNFRKGSK